MRALKQCQLDYDWHFDNVNKKDKETQDLLHQIELGATYDERIKATPKLTQVRRERRISKDIVENTESIIKFVEENKKVINKLSQLLGDIRKVERSHHGRVYKAKIRNDLTI